jgi:hypothetical protein
MDVMAERGMNTADRKLTKTVEIVAALACATIGPRGSGLSTG